MVGILSSGSYSSFSGDQEQVDLTGDQNVSGNEVRCNEEINQHNVSAADVSIDGVDGLNGLNANEINDLQFGGNVDGDGESGDSIGVDLSNGVAGDVNADSSMRGLSSNDLNALQFGGNLNANNDLPQDLNLLLATLEDKRDTAIYVIQSNVSSEESFVVTDDGQAGSPTIVEKPPDVMVFDSNSEEMKNPEDRSIEVMSFSQLVRLLRSLVMAGDSNWDSDSESSYVLLSDVTSVGSDSENFVIMAKDTYLSADSDKNLSIERRHQLKKLVDYSSTDSGDYGGPLNYSYVAQNKFQRYPCKQIGHVCGDVCYDCYDFPGEKKVDEKMDINDVTIEYVLPSLPAKALCKFRSVAKQWDQVHSFLNISGLFLSFVSLNRDASGIPSPSLGFLPEPVAVRTTYNGMLCCESCNGENTNYICNPVIKEWTVLPKSMSYHGYELVLSLAFELNEQYGIQQYGGPQGVMVERLSSICEQSGAHRSSMSAIGSLYQASLESPFPTYFSSISFSFSLYQSQARELA